MIQTFAVHAVPAARLCPLWLQGLRLRLHPPFVQITALLSMLRAMAERRAAGQAASLPRRVYCIWAARTLGEFKSLDAPLLDAAG